MLLCRAGLTASAGLSCLSSSLNMSKTVADRLKLQLTTNRKSNMGFILTPRSTTLDDLELL